MNFGVYISMYRAGDRCGGYCIEARELTGYPTVYREMQGKSSPRSYRICSLTAVVDVS